MENDLVGDGSKSPDVGDAGDGNADFKKLLGQLKKTKEENKTLVDRLAKFGELENKLSKFEQEESKRRDEELTQKGEFKKIIELREKEINDLKKGLQDKDSEVTSYKKDLQDTYKANAFVNSLPGKLRKSEYLTFVDFEKIVFDPTTNSIDKKSVDNVVEEFMKNHGFLVDTSHVRGMPTGQGQINNAPIDFKSLSLKDMKANLKSMIEADKLKMGFM